MSSLVDNLPSMLQFAAVSLGGLASLYLRSRKEAAAAKKAAALADSLSPEEIVETESKRFGKACRGLFALDFDSGFTHCNHGSYGVAPKVVLEAAREQVLRVESFPDQFMRREALNDYKRVCGEVAAFVNAPAKSVVLIENATTGVNAVLHSIPWQRGDVVVINDQTYNACRLAIEHMARKFGLVIKTLSIPLPVSSDEELTDVFRRQLEALADEFNSNTGNSNTGNSNNSNNKKKKKKKFARFALLDHISSPTALVFPLEQLLPLFKEHCELVMVDGAHAPGMLSPLNLGYYGGGLGCDFYTGNLHKWCFCPKGVAFLYIGRPELQARQQPLVISHLTHAADWRERFWMVGTNDQSRALAVPAALSFMLSKGGNAIGAELSSSSSSAVVVALSSGGQEAMARYNHNLCLAATDMLCKMWGDTKPLLPAASMSAPFMRSIKTPLDFKRFLAVVREEGRLLATLSDAEALKLALQDGKINEAVATEIFKASGVQAQIVFWPTFTRKAGEGEGDEDQTGETEMEGGIYCRISCQVYNTLDDYRKLGKAVLDLDARSRSPDFPHHDGRRAW